MFAGCMWRGKDLQKVLNNFKSSCQCFLGRVIIATITLGLTARVLCYSKYFTFINSLNIHNSLSGGITIIPHFKNQVYVICPRSHS